MKVCLVQCPSWSVESSPYSIALLAAILRKRGFEVKCYDLNIKLYNHCQDKEEKNAWLMDERGTCWYEENFVQSFIKRYEPYIDSLIDEILNFNPNIIGFSVYSTSRFFTYEIARKIKNKDSTKKIIIGGPQCFRNCEGIDVLKKPYIDAVCFGEADSALPSMLEKMGKNECNFIFCKGFGYKNKNGQIVDCGNAEIIDNLDILPFADFSDFILSNYTKALLPISTSRGCINRCTFCHESPHWRRYRNRSAINCFREIIFQLNKYPEIKYFWFNDSLFNANIQMLDELCDLLLERKLDIQFGSQGMIKKEMGLEFLKKLKAAGCNLISYGIESGSNNILKKMRKNYTAELAEEVIRNTYNAGIDVIFNIIVGFPGEGEAEFQQTVKFVERNYQFAKEVSLMSLLLLKGSHLYAHRDMFGICSSEQNDQLLWKSIDGENNYFIRIKRLNILKEIISHKSYVTLSDVDVEVQKGDLFYREKKFNQALKCYLSAKEKNRDINKVKYIEEKIASFENLIKPSINEVNIALEFTDICNQHCSMCCHSQPTHPHGEFHPEGFMDSKLWNKLVEELKEGKIKIESITLYWLGESLLHPQFKDMLSQLIELNKKNRIFRTLFLNTNGTLFNQEISELILDYATYIENYRLDNCYLNIHFSLEAVTSKTYEVIKKSKEGTFCNVLNNINYLLQRRKQLELHLPSLTFGFVVMDENKDEAMQFMNFWERRLDNLNRGYTIAFDIKYLKYNDLIYFRCMDDERRSYANRGKELHNQLRKKIMPFTLYHNIHEVKYSKEIVKKKPCFQLWNMIMISRDGIVTPCCKDRFFELEIGNLKKQTLYEILTGDRIKELKLAQIKGEFNRFRLCSSCSEPPGGFLSEDEVLIYLDRNK